MEKLPSAIEIERLILGAILLENGVCDEAMELLERSDFFLDSHRKLFAGMVALRKQNAPIELASLADDLRSKGEFEQAGGATYIASLIDGVPRTDTIAYYAEIVRSKARLRALMLACNSIISLCQDEDAETDIASEAQRLVYAACEERGKHPFRVIGEIARSYLKNAEEMQERGDHITGLPSGFAEFDTLTLGLQRKDLIIIAGRPSQGKTTWSWNMAEAVASDSKTVAYFSLEMGEDKLGEKALSRNARIDSHRLRTAYLGKEEWARLGDTLIKLDREGLYVCDESRLTPAQIRAKSQRLKREHGLDLVVVDFLQLMQGDRRRDRFQMVGENAREMKSVAKDLDVPVVLLSQLSRGAEHKDEPDLSDLRESGDIEQAADIVAFIFRDPGGRENIASVKIGKNRNGPTGRFQLYYQKSINRLDDLTEEASR